MASVLVLDDDVDLRETLGELIVVLGHSCIIAGSLSEVMAQRELALTCHLAILDVNLGNDEPSGLDAFRWLTAQRFAGTTVFLTGHARGHPLVAAACESGARVMDKPIGVSALRALLERKHA